jgi:hypothetical protein
LTSEPAPAAALTARTTASVRLAFSPCASDALAFCVTTAMETTAVSGCACTVASPETVMRVSSAAEPPPVMAPLPDAAADSSARLPVGRSVRASKGVPSM